MDCDIFAFRRLVADFSQKLSKEERRRLVYIRLYDWRERYRDADTLDVLSRLESDGVFSLNNPEGLVEVAKDIDRQDLRAMVKDFVKKRKKEKTTSKVVPMSFESESPVSDEELQLKAILEVTLSQAAVFVKQVDILQQAITPGTKEQRRRAAEAIRDAGCTAQRLAERLQRAQRELEPFNSGSSTSSSRSNRSGFEENEYYNLKFNKGIPEPALLMKSTGTRTETPTPKPRQLQTSFQESQGKPVQIPTEEMCDPAQNAPLDDHQIVYPKAKRWTIIDNGNKSSPLKTRYSLQPKQHVKPAVLPKPSWITSKMPKTAGVRASRDYTTLNPDIENDESTKTGTEDSGFEEWKQHVHQPCAPSPKDPEVHYYKSIRRVELTEDGEYAHIKH